MTFLATGIYTISRTTPGTVDAYGDPADSDDIVVTGVAGSILEQERRVFNPDDSRTNVVRYLTGRFRNGTSIQSGDRIEDESTGDTFIVESWHTTNSAVSLPDVNVDLTRTTAGG